MKFDVLKKAATFQVGGSDDSVSDDANPSIVSTPSLTRVEASPASVLHEIVYSERKLQSWEKKTPRTYPLQDIQGEAREMDSLLTHPKSKQNIPAVRFEEKTVEKIIHLRWKIKMLKKYCLLIFSKLMDSIDKESKKEGDTSWRKEFVEGELQMNKFAMSDQTLTRGSVMGNWHILMKSTCLKWNDETLLSDSESESTMPAYQSLLVFITSEFNTYLPSLKVNMLNEYQSYGMKKEGRGTRRRWLADVILFCLKVCDEEQKRVMRMERGIVSTTLKRGDGKVRPEDVDKLYQVYLELDPYSINVVDIRKEAEMKRSSFGHKERMLWSGRETGYMNQPYVPTRSVKVENTIVEHVEDLREDEDNPLSGVILKITNLNVESESNTKSKKKKVTNRIKYEIGKNKAWIYYDKNKNAIKETRASVLNILNERREKDDMKRDVKHAVENVKQNERMYENTTHLILWEKVEAGQTFQIRAKLSKSLNESDKELPPHVVWDARSERMKVYRLSETGTLKRACYLSEDGNLYQIYAVLDQKKSDELKGDLYTKIEQRSGINYYLKENINITKSLKNAFREDLISGLNYQET